MTVASGGPAVSVIIPTRDRPGPLADCLAALTACAPPAGGFEVIVVDDGGAFSPGPVGRAFEQRLDLILLREPHGGPAAARNAGAARARGRWLAFTDDDCVPAAGWLQALVAALATRSDGAVAVGGRVENGRPYDAWATAGQLLVDAGYRYLNAGPRPRFFAANNMALPTGPFLELGGFDPAFRTWEDRELCARWTGAGGRLRFAPAAVVHHRPGLDARRFVRQHYRYGRGAAAFVRAGRGETRPAPAFYHALVSQAVTGRGPLAAARQLALLGIAHAASAAGAASEALTGRRAGARRSSTLSGAAARTPAGAPPQDGAR